MGLRHMPGAGRSGALAAALHAPDLGVRPLEGATGVPGATGALAWRGSLDWAGPRGPRPTVALDARPIPYTT